VTCYTQPCKPCKVKYIMHYLPQGDESSPRGRWGICAPALPEVLTLFSLGFSFLENESASASVDGWGLMVFCSASSLFRSLLLTKAIIFLFTVVLL
jgi:hypothetical protein